VIFTIRNTNWLIQFLNNTQAFLRQDGLGQMLHLQLANPGEPLCNYPIRGQKFLHSDIYFQKFGNRRKKETLQQISKNFSSSMFFLGFTYEDFKDSIDYFLKTKGFGKKRKKNFSKRSNYFWRKSRTRVFFFPFFFIYIFSFLLSLFPTTRYHDSGASMPNRNFGNNQIIYAYRGGSHQEEKRSTLSYNNIVWC